MPKNVLLTCVYVYHVPSLSEAASRGCQVSCDWSFGPLWAIILVLGIKPGSSVRETNALNHRANFSAPCYQFLILCSKNYNVAYMKQDSVMEWGRPLEQRLWMFQMESWSFSQTVFWRDQIIFKLEWRLQHSEFFQFNETESSNVAQADLKLNDLLFHIPKWCWDCMVSLCSAFKFLYN